MAYLEKILALGQTLERGKAYNVAIAHDEWCEIYEGGACTCDATVKVLDGPPPLKVVQDFKRRCRERRRAARSIQRTPAKCGADPRRGRA